MERPVRAYNNLQNLGYIYQTVNHLVHYVDPVTGVHTNNIEARWSTCKASFKRRYEYMCRVQHPQPDTFETITVAIARQYPV